MSTVSTHVLDTVTGQPAAGMLVRLERAGSGELGRALTDDDGRITDFGVGSLDDGTYRLIFETGPYLRAGTTAPVVPAVPATSADAVASATPTVPVAPVEPPFFPEVIVTFRVDGSRAKYHIPLLLSQYSYATYRGS
jgi:5-hydroxyisourate hydrolase